MAKEKAKAAKKEPVNTLCSDMNCPAHKTLNVRGRTFEGVVVSKFPKRIAIEFERMVYVKKYERYKKTKTKLHARLSDCMKDQIALGDYVKVQECRPLSKIIHFVVVKKIKDKEEKK